MHTAAVRQQKEKGNVQAQQDFAFHFLMAWLRNKKRGSQLIS